MIRPARQMAAQPHTTGDRRASPILGLTPGPFALYAMLQQHEHDEFHPVRRGNERQDNTGKAITRLSHIDFASSRHPHPCATHRPTSHRRPTRYNCHYSTVLRPDALVVSTRRKPMARGIQRMDGNRGGGRTTWMIRMEGSKGRWCVGSTFCLFE